MRCVRQKLTRDQLGVAIIGSTPTTAGEEIEVSAGSLDFRKSTVMSLGSDVQWLREVLLVHEEKGSLTYSLFDQLVRSAADGARMSVWLQRIMAAGAFPTQSELLEFPDPADAALLNSLRLPVCRVCGGLGG